MMKTLVSLFLLPLGMTFWLSVFVAWFLAGKMRWKAYENVHIFAFLIVPVLPLWVFSLPVTGQFLMGGLVSVIDGKKMDFSDRPDVIVVLTGGMYDAGPYGWMPRVETIQRVAAAYELQRLIDIRIPVIISGGFTEGVKVPSEARLAADYFAKMRSEIVPTELEEISMDTAESAEQLAPILRRRSAERVVLISSDIHMPRALGVFRARGIDAIPFPAFSIPHDKGLNLWLPSARGLMLSSSALMEYYGILGYLLTGKMSWADLTYR